MLYPVAEMFYSLQGEGYHVGKPVFFIRLAGCNLKCPWCDTDYSKSKEYTEKEIVHWVQRTLGRRDIYNIVITGGEPSIHDLLPLLKSLRNISRNNRPEYMQGAPETYIAVETNGTFMWKVKQWKQMGYLDWITFSPKPIHDYTKKDRYEAWCVDEIKVVLDGVIIPNAYKLWVGHLVGQDRLYIQACSEDYEPAVKFVLENPEWRLSVQTQKILNIS